MTFRHFDFVAPAPAKIQRGYSRDMADVQAMLEREMITAPDVRAHGPPGYAGTPL